MAQIFKGKTDRVGVQFIRYFFVGGTAFIFDFSVLFFLTSILGIYYLISAAISFGGGLIVNYTLSVFWVFNQRRVNNKNVEFMIFSIIGVLGLFMTEALMWWFTDNIGFYYLISKIITSAIVLLWNFTARKFFLFRG